MIRTSNIRNITIPEGRVQQIEIGNKVAWRAACLYVSLGDSIAAGHTINANWDTLYGIRSQHGENGNLETRIVDDCYTDLICEDLTARYGIYFKGHSFAHSGDTVANLLSKLKSTSYENKQMQDKVKRADIITVMIGANDILQAALSYIPTYVATGNLQPLEQQLEQNLAALADRNNANSYRKLFERITELNPNARVVFSTVYNPLKYLHIEPGNQGFFKPILDLIPNIDIDIDKEIEKRFLDGNDLGYYTSHCAICALFNWNWKWVPIELNLDVDGYIKQHLMNNSVMTSLFNRFNVLSSWIEKYLDGSGSFKGLNKILNDEIIAYQAINPNFVIAQTKQLFDQYPDRTPDKLDDIEYNQLVNIEFTRNFDVSKLDWGQLWQGNARAYWENLAWYGLTFRNGLPSTNISDYVTFDIGKIAGKLIEDIINRVILPDLDPHPEVNGHHVIARSYMDALRLHLVNKYSVFFHANGGSGEMENILVNTVKSSVRVKLPDCGFNAPSGDKYFIGWNTRADGLGTSYVPGAECVLDRDTILYAQWAIRYLTLTVNTDIDRVRYGDPVRYAHYYGNWRDCGWVDTYAVYINDVLQSKSERSEPTKTWTLPAGTKIKLYVASDNDSHYSNHEHAKIYFNGTLVSKARTTTYEFTLDKNTTMNLTYFSPHGLHVCYHEWWDAYITTE